MIRLARRAPDRGSSINGPRGTPPRASGDLLPAGPLQVSLAYEFHFSNPDSNVQTARDVQHVPGDVGGFLAGEVEDRGGDVGDLAEALQGDAGGELGVGFLGEAGGHG